MLGKALTEHMYLLDDTRHKRRRHMRPFNGKVRYDRSSVNLGVQ